MHPSIFWCCTGWVGAIPAALDREAGPPLDGSPAHRGSNRHQQTTTRTHTFTTKVSLESSVHRKSRACRRKSGENPSRRWEKNSNSRTGSALRFLPVCLIGGLRLKKCNWKLKKTESDRRVLCVHRCETDGYNDNELEYIPVMEINLLTFHMWNVFISEKRGEKSEIFFH